MDAGARLAYITAAASIPRRLTEGTMEQTRGRESMSESVGTLTIVERRQGTLRWIVAMKGSLDRDPMEVLARALADGWENHVQAVAAKAHPSSSLLLQGFEFERDGVSGYMARATEIGVPHEPVRASDLVAEIKTAASEGRADARYEADAP